MRKIINFRCEHCKDEFDFNVGDVEFLMPDVKPVFQNRVTCPSCGELKEGQYTLTEIGQTDLTKIFMNTEIPSLQEDV